MFHIRVAEAVKRVEVIDTRGQRGRRCGRSKSGGNVLSAGLLINRTVDGNPPKAGIFGMVCNWRPLITPLSFWGTLIGGALVCTFSVSTEGETSRTTNDGGDGGFW